MPTVCIYIKTEIYAELVRICDQLGTKPEDFIREAVIKWVEAKRNVYPRQEEA
jgi:hypothetical protein